MAWLRLQVAGWMSLLLLAGPAVAGDRYDPAAPVSILVFSAFACPYCEENNRLLEQLQARYPGRISIAFKHFPLGLSDADLLPHEVAAAAALQGKFWPVHDALVRTRAKGLTRERILAAAAESTDARRLNADLQSGAARAIVQRDMAEAKALKVTATPTLFIDGYRLDGLQKLETLERLAGHRLGAPAER